jgi:hypothetical protein
MRPLVSAFIAALLTATPVLAQTEQEAANTNESEISSTVAAPGLGLESWTPTLAPTNAAELMVMPLAERLSFSAADPLAGPEPAPMSTVGKVAIVALIVVVLAAATVLILCSTEGCG